MGSLGNKWKEVILYSKMIISQHFNNAVNRSFSLQSFVLSFMASESLRMQNCEIPMILKAKLGACSAGRFWPLRIQIIIAVLRPRFVQSSASWEAGPDIAWRWNLAGSSRDNFFTGREEYDVSQSSSDNYRNSCSFFEDRPPSTFSFDIQNGSFWQKSLYYVCKKNCSC